MAYGVRYNCEWVSPMREKREYIISIMERDYEGVVGELRPTGDVLTITQGVRDEEEFTPFRPSEAELTLLCTEEGSPYISLFTTDPTRYMMRIMRRMYDRRGVAKVVTEWCGLLNTCTYTQDYGVVPYEVSLRASDGIALLRDMPFVDTDGTHFEGRMSLWEIVTYILGRLPSELGVEVFAEDNIVTPEQKASTLQLLGVDVEGLYVMLGGQDVPSCYDVLEAILKSLQLQLFQGYGAWHIRSLGALTSVKKHPLLASDVNGGVDIMSLYTDDGDDTGVSVSATLSLRAPYRKLTVQRPELQATTEGGAYPQALDPMMWVSAFGGVKLSTYARKERMIRLKSSLLKKSKSEDIGCALLPDIIFERAQQTTLSVTFDLYNLHTKDKEMRMMLLAYDAECSIVDGLFAPSTKRIEVSIPLAYWDATKSKWVEVEKGVYEQPSTPSAMGGDYPFVSGWQTLTLSAAPKINYFDRPVPTSYMSHTSVSLDISTMDVAVAKSMRLALVFAGKVGEPLSSIEVRNPAILFTDAVEGVEDVKFDEALISTSGMGDIAFGQTLADAWVRPTSGHSYQVPLINLITGCQMRGLIAPQQRSLVADIALYNMRALRGKITQVIDGELYAKTRIDLNARWRDREGRVFYTNYIRRLYRRGIYEVQLCEIPIFTPAGFTGAFEEGVSAIVGLDTRAYWLNTNRDALDTYDMLTGKFSNVLLAELNQPLTLNEGQRCACLVEQVRSDDGDEYDYILRAYSTEGVLISEVDSLKTLAGAGIVNFDSFARSAKYDANIGMWTLVDSSAKSTTLMLITRDGEVAGKNTYTASSYLRVTSSTISPNGFVVTTHPSTLGDFYTWWHSNSEHLDAAIVRLATNIDILAVNESMIVQQHLDTSTLAVYARTDVQLGHGDEALIELSAASHAFITMNNALVVFREVVDGNLGAVKVYDARTGRALTIAADKTTVVWLSGDMLFKTVYMLGNLYHMSSTRIMLGDGVAYEAYVGIDGKMYETTEGLIYNVMK